MKSQFSNMPSSLNSFWRCCVSLFKFSYSPKFKSVALLVLELFKLLFIKDWPEIKKLEILPPKYCSLSADRSKLGIPNLARMSLMKSYQMLQNDSVTAFNFCELFRKNQNRMGSGEGGGRFSPTQIRFKFELSPSKITFYLLQRKLFKNNEKCFLFYLKSSFRFQDI